jgi:Domain of unknown function (DUF5615)
LGHDLITPLGAGIANRAIPDAEVLAFAAADDRILLTHNRRHFQRLIDRRNVLAPPPTSIRR